MFATTHILTSVVISQHIQSSWWAFFISLASHYLLDLIPHGDAPLGPWMTVDQKKRRLIYVLGTDAFCTILYLSILWLYGDLPNLSILIPAMVGSVLPDFIWLVSYVLKKRDFKKNILPLIASVLDRVNAFHHAIHSVINQKIQKLWPGLLIQLIFIGGLIYLTISWR
ncbi:MAG: hypothetical protein WCT27_00320 [Patescibacteria group bacterium]